MTELAKLIRTERGLAINETQISKEVIRILEFESDLANVRHLGFPSGFLLSHLSTTITLPETLILSFFLSCIIGSYRQET